MSESFCSVSREDPEDQAVYSVTANDAAGDYLLPNQLPKAEYMYGCVATSVGMLLGYYDLYGYTVNGRRYDFSNLISGTISVNSRGSDGGSIYDMTDPSRLAEFIASDGYISRFYGTTSSEELNDTFISGDPARGLNVSAWDSLADYLGTGQYWRAGSDLSTRYYYTSLKNLYTTTQTKTLNGKTYSIRYVDFKYGLDLYVKSRGFSLDQEGTVSYEKNDFSFADLKAEIDAGRPVLISMESGSSGHMVIAYGYNASTNEIIFDDTYRDDCRMSWNGTYSYSGKNYSIDGATTVKLSVQAEDPQPPEGIEWLTNYNEALRIAQMNNVPILVYYGNADTCYYCSLLEENVFESEEFRQYTNSGSVVLLQNTFIPGLISGSYGTPLCFLLNPDGSVISKHSGYSSGWMDWFERYVDLQTGTPSRRIDLTSGTPIIAQTPDAVHSQSEFLIGDNVYISMIVRNNGNVSTGRKTNVKILIDGNEAANREIPVLEANGTCTISVNLGSSFTEGNHTWAVQIDADGTLEESIETNNDFSGNFSVIRSPYDEITTRLTCSTAISNVKILQGGSLGAIDGARITNADIKGGFFYLSSGAAAYNVKVSSGYAKVSSGGYISGGIVSGGSMILANYGSGEDITVFSGGLLNVFSRATAENLTILSGGSGKLTGTCGGTVHIGGTVTFGSYTTFLPGTDVIIDLSGRNSEDPAIISNFKFAKGLNVISVRVAENQSPGAYQLAEDFETFTGTIKICSTAGVCYQSITVGSSFQTSQQQFSLTAQKNILTLSVTNLSSPPISSGGTSSGGIISSGGTSSGGIISSGGTSSGGIISSGGTSSGGIISSGGTSEKSGVEVFSGGVFISSAAEIRNKTVLRNTVYKVNNGGLVENIAIKTGGTIQVSSGGRSEDIVISSGGGLHIFSGARTVSTTVMQNGYLGIGNGATAESTEIAYAGSLTVWGGGIVSSSIIHSVGTIILSSGAAADNTIIESKGGLHVFSGAAASNTTVQQGGFFGVGNGARTYHTTIDSAGSLTVWGGGIVYDNTICTKGALILSSGAAANSSLIHSAGGLHVFSGAAASNTTVQQGGFFGVGNGARTYHTTIDSAGSLTVWGGGIVYDNTINQWGAIILSSGAAASNTIIKPNGGLHIFRGASAYAATVTSGAMLGLGGGGYLADSVLERNAVITFYDGSILAGTNNFNGTVRTAGDVNAADAVICFDLESRTQEDDFIIQDLKKFRDLKKFVLEVGETQRSGTYRIAAGVEGFSGSLDLRKDGISFGKLAANRTFAFGDYQYTLHYRDQQLLVNIIAC